MIEKIPTIHISRDAWLQERLSSIGGSDAGAILGLNSYRSPYTVWAEKTRRLPEQEDNEAMRQGRDLETYVAQRFAEKSGKRVERYNYLLRNTDAPYLHANIDRRVIGEKSGLECKTASALAAKFYRCGQFPESYYAQCVTYLAVTGWERWYLAVLVLNKSFFIFQMTTLLDDTCPEWCESSVFVSQEEISSLKAFSKDFWERYVMTDTPPVMDGSGSTSRTIATIYGCPLDDSIQLLGREDILLEWDRLKKQKDEIQLRQNQIRQILMQDLGQASEGLCGDWKILWREQKRGNISLEKLRKNYPSINIGKVMTCRTFRIFRIQKG